MVCQVGQGKYQKRFFSPNLLTYCGRWWHIKAITFLNWLYVSLDALSINSLFDNPIPPKINEQIWLFSSTLCLVYNTDKWWSMLPYQSLKITISQPINITVHIMLIFYKNIIQKKVIT